MDVLQKADKFYVTITPKAWLIFSEMGASGILSV